MRTSSVSLLAFLLAPVALGVGNLAVRLPRHGVVATVDVPDRPAPPARRHDRLAVLLVGNGGTEITDALAPVEVLGASGLYDVVTVAPVRRASPFTDGHLEQAGLDVLPHYGFGTYEAEVGEPPDLLLIPWLPAFEGADAALLPWIRDHVGPETVVVSVCAGGKVLAATGLLDGHRATATYGMVPELAVTYPAVHWTEGVRFAVDGRFVSSSTLATGIDAALAAVATVGGREAAERAARVSGYRGLHVLDDPRLDVRRSPAGLLRGAWTLRRADVAVWLEDGVREAAVAAHLDGWPQSLADTATAVAARPVVRTRHGLDLVVPRTEVGGFDRVESAYVPDGTFPHDHVLARIADVEGAWTAHAVASNQLYALRPESSAPPYRASLLGNAVAVGLLAALATFALRILRWPLS